MSCSSESRNSSNLGPTTPVGVRTTNLSRHLSSSNQLSGLLATTGSKDYRLNSCHADYNADSRITMKTRVAVRDNTPHRFQVVPLRDVSKFASLEAGHSSHLALPPVSHTLLRSASIRRQTHAQVGPVIASSPHSQMDISTRYNYKISLADSEALATSQAERSAMPALALSPSFELRRSHVLAEKDMNRRCTESTTHKIETSITSPTNAQPSYVASHVQYPAEVFSDRSSSVHTTSQSLDLALCNTGTYPKMPKRNAPEHVIAIVQSSIMDSNSPRKTRTRSENIPSSFRDNNQRECRNDPAATVTMESCDSKMTKRHAIYTQSLYVPFLESPGYFPGSSQLPGTHSNETVPDRHPERVSFNQQAFVSDTGAKIDSDDQSSPTTRRVLPKVTASEQSLQAMLKPRASPHTSSLNYHRLSHVYPLSAEPRLHNKIVYSQIICEMFTDIDRAIHEWRNMD